MDIFSRLVVPVAPAIACNSKTAFRAPEALSIFDGPGQFIGDRDTR